MCISLKLPLLSRVTNSRFRVTNRVLRVANRLLRVTSRVLRVANRLLRVTSRVLRVANRLLRITNRSFRVANRLVRRTIGIEPISTTHLKNYAFVCIIIVTFLPFPNLISERW